MATEIGVRGKRLIMMSKCEVAGEDSKFIPPSPHAKTAHARMRLRQALTIQPTAASPENPLAIVNKVTGVMCLPDFGRGE